MWMVKVERTDCEGRYVRTEVYYYRNKENAEKRAEEERANRMTTYKVTVEEVVTED